MVWKVVNISDTGTSIKHGANDLDKHSNLFNGVDVDDVTINADWEFQKGIVIKTQSEPSSPASGKAILFEDSADGIIKIKKSNGDVIWLE